MFLLLFLYLALQLITGVFHLDMSFICWFMAISVFSVVSGVVIPEEVDGVGGNWLEHTAVVNLKALLEAF